MKRSFEALVHNVEVAPLVGAWIETPSTIETFVPGEVAPLVGAWIETSQRCNALTLRKVAPLVGAWIETISGYYRIMIDGGRSPRGSVD